MMKTPLVLIGLLAIFVSCQYDHKNKINGKSTVQSDASTYSRGSKINNYSFEYNMSFSHKVWVDDEFISNIDEDTAFQTVSDHVTSQIEHLFGSFKMNRFKGVPKLGDHQETIIDWYNGQYEEETNEWVFEYTYKGMALIDDLVKDKINLAIPRNPKKIFQQGLENRKINHCTDKNYNTDQDHWYFWNINNRRCHLKEGVHFDLVEIDLEKIPNTTETYPEYDRLIQTNENGDKYLSIYVFYGNVHEEEKIPLNLKGVDELQRVHKEMTQYMSELNFQKTQSKKLAKAALIHRYEKNLDDLKIYMNVFYGNTGYGEKDSIEFHKIYKQSLEEGAVIIYAGHSGLGGHLDTYSISQDVGGLTIPKDRYQIIYFESCSSYPYYAEMYFNHKKGAIKPDGSIDDKGTYNFDIITNGLSSYFATNTSTMHTFLQNIHDAFALNQKNSWQDIIDQIYFKVIDEHRWAKGFLTGINGDEDNPTRLE